MSRHQLPPELAGYMLKAWRQDGSISVNCFGPECDVLLDSIIASHAPHPVRFTRSADRILVWLPRADAPLRDRYQCNAIDRRAAIVELAATFPTMREWPWALEPKAWNPEGVARFDGSVGPQCDGAVHSARFILSVWNPCTRWKAGRFDLHAALGCWDASHRAAFAAWVAEPWWP